jgi:hypothetical protein
MTRQIAIAARRSNTLLVLSLAALAIAHVWWLAYFAPFGGAFGWMDLKLACVSAMTNECRAFAGDAREIAWLPRYQPGLWWAAMVALTLTAARQIAGR